LTSSAAAPWRLRVRWPPGERFAYSNRGYLLVAHILERVAGRPYEEVVDREVVRPLGLEDAAFALEPEARPRLARGYLDATGPPAPYRPARFRAPANALASLRDLAALTRFFLARGQRPDGRRHLRVETLRRMERPETSAAARAGCRFGAGLGVNANPRRARPVWGHYGGGYAYQVVFQYLPDAGRGYVLAVNASHTRPGFDAANALLLEHLARDLPPPELPASAPVPETLEGWYWPGNPRHQPLAFLETLLGAAQLRVTPEEALMVPWTGAPRRLEAFADGTLRLEGHGVPSLVALERGPGGVVLAGDGAWMERQRWAWPWLLRGAILLAAAAALSALLHLPWWWRGPGGSLGLARGLLLADTLLLVGTLGLAHEVPVDSLGRVTPATLWIAVSGPLYVLGVLAALAAAARALRRRGRSLATVAVLGAALGHLGSLVALGSAGFLGIRLW